jgi:O-antigen/teichoic acid export membrane protein
LAQWFNSDGGLYATYGWVVPPMLLSEVCFLMLRGISRSQHRSIAPVFAREFMLRILQTALIAAYIIWRMPFGLFIAFYAGTFVATTILLAVELQRAGALKLGLKDIRVPKRLRRSMVRYGVFTFGSGMAGIAVGSIDQVMLGALLHDGLANVAYYSIAVFLAGLINVPARALILPTMPLLAEAWRAKDHGMIARIYHRTASVQLVVAAFILLGLWACMDPLFTFLKPGYGLGKPVMIVLGFTQLVMLSQGVAGSVVSTSRNYRFDAVSSILFLVMNIGLDLLFIPWWGMIGAAWSSLVSAAAVVAWRVFFLRSRYRLWPYDGRTALTLLLFSCVGAALWWLPHLHAPVADIAVRGTLVAVLFWPLVHWLKIAPELGDQLLKLLRRLRELVPGA